MKDDYVAWLRWFGDESHRHLIVCDSDAPGAFKVWRFDPSELYEALEGLLEAGFFADVCSEAWVKFEPMKPGEGRRAESAVIRARLALAHARGEK